MSSEYFSSSSSSTRPILPISKHAVKIITSSTGLRVCNTCIVVVIKSISNYTVNEIEKSVIFINIWITSGLISMHQRSKNFFLYRMLSYLPCGTAKCSKVVYWEKRICIYNYFLLIYLIMKVYFFLYHIIIAYKFCNIY